MTEGARELSDEAVRRALRDVAAASHPTSDLADRLLANARAGGPAVVGLAGRRRARWAAPLLAAAVVAALALGGVALGSTLADRKNPTTTQGPTLTVPPPSPSSPSPSPSPTTPSSTAPSLTTPSPRTSSTPSSRSATNGAPDRPDLTAAALSNAKIDIPAWTGVANGKECRSGTREFHDGRATLPSQWPASQSYQQFEGAKAVVDVDGDGSDDVVAVLFCGIHQPIGYRVLAFRARIGGGVEVIGDVTPLTGYSAETSLLGGPESVKPGPQGSVVVRWRRTDQPDSPTQDRTYRFSGGRFRQVAGPTHFGDRSADLSVTTKPAVLVSRAGGRDGTVTAVVRNDGPGSSGPDPVLLIERHGVRMTAANGSGGRLSLDDFDAHTQRVFLPTLAAGDSYTVEFTAHASASATTASVTFDISGSSDGDPDASNNTATAACTLR